jgi:hypothetical protein
MRKRILYLLIFLSSIPFTSQACSCDWVSFCDVMDGDEDAYIFKGVVSTKTYQNDYQAVYIYLLEEYRDDYNNDKTRLKILGSENVSWCDVPVHERLNTGDTIYLALKYLSDYHIDNPDEEKDKNTFVFAASLCGFKLIKPINEYMLGGDIKGERNSPDLITQYPKKYFERDLEGCNFSNDVATSTTSHELINFKIFPNPISGSNTFKINSGSARNPIDQIEVYNIQGILIHTYGKLDENNMHEFDASFLPNGAYIFRINSGVKIFTQKVFII